MDGAVDNLYRTKSYNGEDVFVPENVDVSSDPYLPLTSAASIQAYYADQGYVVLRGLIPHALCDLATTAFNSEVKTFTGHLYRQPSGGKPEPHTFTPAGFMKNSILNVHDLPSRQFGTFRSRSLEILSHDAMKNALHAILGTPGKLVQSMYFEGNPNTWPHQDTYYLDSEKIGSMVAAWVAVEDIAPGAGRFYVCPGSHKFDVRKNGGDFDVAFHHERYKQLTASIIETNGFKIHAPALQKGDVLFWNSRTIHGSLPTTQSDRSRASFTGHYLPEADRFMQFQSRIRDFQFQFVNEMRINHPKDQDRLKNRVVLGLERTFPRAFQTVKNVAIKIVTR